MYEALKFVASSAPQRFDTFAEVLRDAIGEASTVKKLFPTDKREAEWQYEIRGLKNELKKIQDGFIPHISMCRLCAAELLELIK